MVHPGHEEIYIKNAVSSVEDAFKKVFGNRAGCYIAILHDQAIQESVTKNAYVADPVKLRDSIIYTYFCVGKKIIDSFSSGNDVVYSINGKKVIFLLMGKFIKKKFVFW